MWLFRMVLVWVVIGAAMIVVAGCGETRGLMHLAPLPEAVPASPDANGGARRSGSEEPALNNLEPLPHPKRQ